MINKLAKSLFGHCHKQLGFKNPPRLFLRTDAQNAKTPLGKTAYYNPAESSVTIYISGRHVKDVLRSLAHELIHHHQNERGDLANCAGETGPGYAQKNKNLRKMEEEAYLKGNMLFRDWEDSCKAKFQMEENTMKMQLKDLRKLIQKSILEVLNKENETVTEEENTENETVTEEENVEAEAVTEEENAEVETVTEEEVSNENETVTEEEEVETVNEMGNTYKRDDDKDLKESEDDILDEEDEPELEETANNYMTPEKEIALRENYMGAKRANLFERLTKKWAK